MNKLLLAEITIAYAIFSDYADGYFARKLNKTTLAGALTDAIADKVFIYFCSFGYYFKINNYYFSLVLLIWIMRDLALNLVHVKKIKRFKSLFSGKCFTAAQFIIIFFIIIFHHLNWDISLIMKISMPMFLVLGIYSVLQYKKSYGIKK